MAIKLYQGGTDAADQPPMAAPGARMDEKGQSQTASDDGVMQINPDIAADSAGSQSAGGYHIQVQSYADEMSAIQSVERLKQMGHPAQIAETDVDGKIWYRVQIGEYPDRATAQEAKDALSGQGLTDTLIIKNDQ